MARTDEEAGFLSRWSRLKQENQAETQEVVEKNSEEPEEDVEEPDEAEAEALPDIETLGEGSDFKPFMKAEVPSDVRNEALKKLWSSNPLYNVMDGLDDYCEDYTDAACAVPNVKTYYKVGRGLMDRIAELEQQAADKLSEETASNEAKDAQVDVAENANLNDEDQEVLKKSTKELDQNG